MAMVDNTKVTMEQDDYMLDYYYEDVKQSG
jgi:hypothetical protein